MAGSRGRHPDSSPTDEQLIARVLAGDQDAYTVLVERHSDLVYAIVSRIVFNEADADDVAQDTFVRAYHALPRFRGDSKFSSWLYRIAVNRSLTHLKRTKRRAAALDPETGARAEVEASLAATREGPHEAVLRQERRAAVRAAVADLPPRYRAVVTLFYLEEKNYKEVAEILGIPMGTLKTHLHRARALLKDALANRDAEGGTGP
jgi:RNA polymerase sigma-70 factor (ECF subfamily)